MTSDADTIAELIRHDPLRWELMGHVRTLGLPDCWIAAGFVRNAVWSVLHGNTPALDTDIDVIWFDDADSSASRDAALERDLERIAPNRRWSVKNQARMHRANGDTPYASSEDAMRYWPETATAVGVRRTSNDHVQVLAPFGLQDLLGLTLRPAGAFKVEKRYVFERRVREKLWLVDFPKLKLVD